MSDPLTPGAQNEPAAGGSAGPAAPDQAPAARRYTAPDLDAPQYAVPAYAAPEPGDAAPAGGSPRRYAAPQGYALPRAVLGAEPAPEAAGAPFPPYARVAIAQAPASPGAPGDGGSPGYPGTPGWAAPPAAAVYPSPGSRDDRPKTLAIIALILAGAGVLLAFVPYVAGALGPVWLSFLLLFGAFVLSIVALASRNQGGKGIGIGALITSILGGVLTVALAIAWVFGSFSSSYGSGVDPGWDDDYSGDTYDDYSVPGLAAPGTDGQPDPGVEFAPPAQPTVVETAFGHDYDDVWWYVVVIDNPNADYVFDAYMEVQAVTEDGSSVAPSTAFATLLTGQTAIVGYIFDVGDTQITSIDVELPQASEATLSPAGETGTFTVDGITRSSSDGGGTTATGTLSARFAEDQRYVSVTVLARAPDGAIVAAATAYVEDVPGDGTPVPFEVWFSELPADATLQAFANR